MFDKICEAIPGLEPWVRKGKSRATTNSFGFGKINAIWRSFVKDNRPEALNYFAVGDVAVRTNPLYGRGCSTGLFTRTSRTSNSSNNCRPKGP